MQTVGITLVLLASLSASPSKLVSLDVDEGPIESGKTLKMEFREIERRGDESTIHVKFHSGGSVSSSMFIVKGSCAIAKSRAAKYFRQTSESETADGAWVYTVAFANTPDAKSLKIPSPPAKPTEGEDEALANGVFSDSDCLMLGFAK